MKTNISEFRADYKEYICDIFLYNTKFKFYREVVCGDGDFVDVNCYFSKSMYNDDNCMNNLMYNKDNLEEISEVVDLVWTSYKKKEHYDGYIYNMIEAEIKNDLTILLTYILESNDAEELMLSINVKYKEGR